MCPVLYRFLPEQRDMKGVAETKCWVFCRCRLVSSAESIRTVTSTSAAAAGAPRGLGNLHNNATTAALNKVERLLPATKGQVQDVKADFEEYKNETTTLIDALVSEVNSLTPVGSHSLPHVKVCGG